MFALQMSEDELKNQRATAKGKLTRIINKLRPLLESTGEAALENEQQISDIGKDLDVAVSSFNSCHEAYCKVTEKAAAAKDLEKVEVDNENYVEDVKANVYNIQSLGKKYKESLRVHKESLKVIEEAKKNIPDAKINFDRSREDYVNTKTLAENVS